MKELLVNLPSQLVMDMLSQWLQA